MGGRSAGLDRDLEARVSGPNHREHEHLGALLTDYDARTDRQIPAWEGPEGIRPSRPFTLDEGASRTPTLAVPDDRTKDALCLDDWKAYAPAADPETGDEVPIRRKDARRLCGVEKVSRDGKVTIAAGGCPIAQWCLDSALEEEGSSSPHHRAGARGGATPRERFLIAVGDRVCPKGHKYVEHGGIKPSGAAYCKACNRTYDSNRLRYGPIECPMGCGASISRQNLARHQASSRCVPQTEAS